MTNDEVKDEGRLLTVQQVADELQIPVRTLRDWAYRGIGPRRLRIGNHVRYRRSDLEEWLDTRYAD